MYVFTHLQQHTNKHDLCGHVNLERILFVNDSQQIIHVIIIINFYIFIL